MILIEMKELGSVDFLFKIINCNCIITHKAKVFFQSTRRKERIADACTGHGSDVFLIKYGVGPVVSMG